MNDDDREELRRHLVEAHHWPAVSPYDPTPTDLESLHGDLHNSKANLAAVVERIRQVLGMPNLVTDAIEDQWLVDMPDSEVTELAQRLVREIDLGNENGHA
jgi:hypothetical protein